MKQLFKFFAILITLSVFNCNEKTLSEYKFSDKEPVLSCDALDSKLLNEALYAFEDDIKTFYRNKYNPEGKLDLVYSEFLSRSIRGIVPFEELVTPHTLEIFKVLKTKKELWNPKDGNSKLNYYNDFFNCIASNVEDENLKTTLNALVSTQSMNPRLFTEPLIPKYRILEFDKYLSAYVAFDLFYAKLFDIDESKVKERVLMEYL